MRLPWLPGAQVTVLAAATAAALTSFPALGSSHPPPLTTVQRGQGADGLARAESRQDHARPGVVRRKTVPPAGSGATLFREKRCSGCHRLNDEGGALGPDLSHVGSRLPYEMIDAVLTEPRSVNPRAVMPEPGLVPPERNELAQFLAGLR